MKDWINWMEKKKKKIIKFKIIKLFIKLKVLLIETTAF